MDTKGIGMRVVATDKRKEWGTISGEATQWINAWIRFPLSGKLVMGEVRYVTAPSPGTLILHTEQGEVDSTNIFEVRW